MNLVEATVDGRHRRVRRLPPAARTRAAPAPRRATVILGIRPESFEDADVRRPALPQIEVEVAVVEELGSDAHVIFPIDAPRVSAEDLEAAADEPLEGADRRRPALALQRAGRPADESQRTGRAITLAVDPAQFHFFDPETGATLRREPALLAAGG